VAVDTKTFPVMNINRVITVEMMMQKIRPHKHGWAALAILAILVNKRSNGEGPWIELTGVEWRKRTGGTLQKGRGAKALEELGLVRVQRNGQQSLHFRLADEVDPTVPKRTSKKTGGLRKSSSEQLTTRKVWQESDEAKRSAEIVDSLFAEDEPNAH